MSTLVNEVGATEAGFDTKRLRHLDAHFEQYVDDGRLPGFIWWCRAAAKWPINIATACAMLKPRCQLMPTRSIAFIR